MVSSCHQCGGSRLTTGQNLWSIRGPGKGSDRKVLLHKNSHQPGLSSGTEMCLSHSTPITVLKTREDAEGLGAGGGCSSDILPGAGTVGLKGRPGQDSRRKGAGAGRQLPCSTGQEDAVGPHLGSEDPALSPQDQGPALVGV